MMNLRAIMKLVRVEHSIMLCLGVITVIALLDVQFEVWQILLLFAVPFLVSAGAFALNDYFDVESDRINDKKTPIVTGEIERKDALRIAILCLVIGVALAIPLGTSATVTALLFMLLSIAYDWKLKDIALVGNMIIASSMAIVFVFTELSLIGSISKLIIFISAVSFLSGLGREIQKTVQDMKGDLKGRKSKTLPMIIGRNNALNIAAVLIVSASALALYLFSEIEPLKQNYAYLVIALVSITGFAYSTKLFYGNEKEMERGRRYSLYSLLLGIIAFMAGGLYT